MIKTLKNSLNLLKIVSQFLFLLTILPTSWTRQYLPNCRVKNNSVVLLVRTTDSGSGLSSIFFSGVDLYDNTMESLQWLVPTDIRRFNVFSPQSTYQINMRYRNDPSVKRYFGYQLWKIHENDVANRDLNQFWKLFG